MQATRTLDCNVSSPVLYVALELSKSTWKLSMTDSLGRHPRMREIAAGDWRQLQCEIERTKAHWHLPAETSVVSCYEAGRDGFWIHRVLMSLGWTNHVIDPASLEVTRRRRRAKTDRLDAHRMVMALIRYWVGDRYACRVVNVPGPEDEDARQLHRELECLKEEKTAHVNRLKGLLFAQGICLGATTRAFPDWLAQVRTGDGRELPRQLKDRLLREFERLQLLVRQIRALERQRAAFFRQALRAQTHDQLPGWQPVAAELRQFCGIGEGAALTLATELFGWRELKNRRQVAALAGLAPSPWQSGESVDEEQGISKAGRGPLRALLVEIAWGWLRYQMDSSLSQWFMTRFAHGNSRQRRIGIVALARKLLVALWKFVHTGELPEGVRLTKNPYQFSYTPSLE